MNKKTLRLAIPNIISNLTVPLLGMVDVAIVGHLGSDALIGAIAVAGVIFSFIYWNLGFLRMGTSGFTAQAYGARNLQECFDILLRALIIGGALALVILLFQRPIATFSFFLVEASPAVAAPALQYFFIRVWAAPATFSFMDLTDGLLECKMQNSQCISRLLLILPIYYLAISLFIT